MGFKPFQISTRVAGHITTGLERFQLAPHHLGAGDAKHFLARGVERVDGAVLAHVADAHALTARSLIATS